MEAITLSGVQKLTSPNPFALLTSDMGGGKTNVMALSWWMYACNKPEMIAVCVSNKGYTHELIEKSGEFCLCLPTETIREAAFKCGTVSGRAENKAEAFGIALSSATTVAAQYVTDSAAVLECRVEQTLPAGDHILFLAKVTAAHGDKNARPLFAMNGYGALDTAH